MNRIQSDQYWYNEGRKVGASETVSNVLGIMDKHIKEAQKTDDDISMLCAVMIDIAALKGGE